VIRIETPTPTVASIAAAGTDGRIVAQFVVMPPSARMITSAA
jgi:hypothetical protein